MSSITPGNMNWDNHWSGLVKKKTWPNRMGPGMIGMKTHLSALRACFSGTTPTYLSIGCGRASLECNLLSEYNIVLSDLSFNLIKWLNRFHDESLVLSAFQIPFKDNSFDIIVSEGLFEHFSDDDKIQSAINEICKVSKKYIVIVVPCSDSIIYTKVKAGLIAKGRWSWGYERDFSSFKPYFDTADVVTIYETTIGGKSLSNKYAGQCPDALDGTETLFPYPYLLSVAEKTETS